MRWDAYFAFFEDADAQWAPMHSGDELHYVNLANIDVAYSTSARREPAWSELDWLPANGKSESVVRDVTFLFRGVPVKRQTLGYYQQRLTVPIAHAYEPTGPVFSLADANVARMFNSNRAGYDDLMREVNARTQQL